MKWLHMVAFILLIAGGLNWLLVGVADFNLVYWLLGGVHEMLPDLVYILVGVSALYEVATHWSRCKECSAGGSMAM